MATYTYKCLEQSIPSAASDTDMYTVPASTSVIGSTIVVCNQSASAGTYRVAIRKAGASLTGKQYLFYDQPIDANTTHTWTIGFTLATTDVVTVRSASGSISFNLFGTERT